MDIVFDFDGVIADSFDLALATVQMSMPSMTSESYRAMFNGNINDAKPKEKVVRQIDFFEEFSKKFLTLGMTLEVKETLLSISNDNRLFIISSSTNALIEEYLKRHGVLDCFSSILGVDIEKSKVKKFKMLFADFEVDPEALIFVTDTSGDIREAKTAGVKNTFGILGGYQDESIILEAEPTGILRSFNNIKGIFDK